MHTLHRFVELVPRFLHALVPGHRLVRVNPDHLIGIRLPTQHLAPVRRDGDRVEARAVSGLFEQPLGDGKVSFLRAADANEAVQIRWVRATAAEDVVEDAERLIGPLADEIPHGLAVRLLGPELFALIPRVVCLVKGPVPDLVRVLDLGLELRVETIANHRRHLADVVVVRLVGDAEPRVLSGLIRELDLVFECDAACGVGVVSHPALHCMGSGRSVGPRHHRAAVGRAPVHEAIAGGEVFPVVDESVVPDVARRAGLEGVTAACSIFGFRSARHDAGAPSSRRSGSS
jgi:hypothetical protein